ncbi:MAG: hypothetical protein MZV64_25970 [Ignavibacteriales bacterium]|nr:hypothetical protein [Ignavibacteriales bacterium]
MRLKTARGDLHCETAAPTMLRHGAGRTGYMKRLLTAALFAALAVVGVRHRPQRPGRGRPSVGSLRRRRIRAARHHPRLWEYETVKANGHHAFGVLGVLRRYLRPGRVRDSVTNGDHPARSRRPRWLATVNYPLERTSRTSVRGSSRSTLLGRYSLHARSDHPVPPARHRVRPEPAPEGRADGTDLKASAPTARAAVA